MCLAENRLSSEYKNVEQVTILLPLNLLSLKKSANTSGQDYCTDILSGSNK